MAALAIPNTFVSGNTITAAGHNQNFSEVQTYINNRNSGSATWDNMNATTAVITTLTLTSLSFIPSGTKMLFYQASAPTGWTAVALNDKFLRVVTAGGTGGTSGGSGLAPSSTITLAHTHTVAAHTHTGPSHTHSIGALRLAHSAGSTTNPTLATQIGSADSAGAELFTVFENDGSAAGYQDIQNQTEAGTTGAEGTGATGSASPATDSQLSNTAFQYADVIVCTKD